MMQKRKRKIQLLTMVRARQATTSMKRQTMARVKTQPRSEAEHFQKSRLRNAKQQIDEAPWKVEKEER